MADILIRGLKHETLARLKRRAKMNARSLQTEAKRLLEQSADTNSHDITAIFDRWRKRFAGRRFSSSVKVIRSLRND